MISSFCSRVLRGEKWKVFSSVERLIEEVRGGPFHSVNSVVELLLKLLENRLVEELLWKVVQWKIVGRALALKVVMRRKVLTLS